MKILLSFLKYTLNNRQRRHFFQPTCATSYASFSILNLLKSKEQRSSKDSRSYRKIASRANFLLHPSINWQKIHNIRMFYWYNSTSLNNSYMKMASLTKIINILRLNLPTATHYWIKEYNFTMFRLFICSSFVAIILS